MILNALGFSFFLFAEFICFHGTILFPEILGFSQEMGIFLMLISMASKTLGYFGSSFLASLRFFSAGQGGKVGIILYIGGILMMSNACTVSESFPLEFCFLPTPLLAGAGIGLGDALINLTWGQLCTTMPLRKTYLFVLGCHGGALLLYATSFFVANSFQPVFVIVALCFVALSFSKQLTTPENPPHFDALRAAFIELWRPLFVTSLFCFLAGLIPWISGQYEGAVETMRFASFVSTFILLVVLALPLLFTKKPFALENVYTLLLPLVATGFLLLPFIWNGLGGIVNVFAGVGAYAASIILWCLSADSARRHHLRSATLFGFCLGVSTLMSTLGKAFGYFSGKSLSEGDLSITAFSLVCLYFFSMLALFVFKRQKSLPILPPEKVKNFSSPASSEQQLLICTHLAQEYRLSKREAEILIYLIQGATMASIARLLSLSENTVRTYIKRIYQKFGVHSKQDIIDLYLNRIKTPNE